MATWELRARLRLALGSGSVLRVRLGGVTLVSGAALAMVATAAMWMSRGTPQVAQVFTPAAASWGALEVPPSARAQAALTISALGGSSNQGERFVLTFGHYARRDRALAYARVVRSKGYIASVVQTDQGFTVVSRSYASLEAARFWSAIFEEIGIEVRAVTRREAALYIFRVL